MTADPTPSELLACALEATQAAGKVLAEKFLQERTIEFKGGEGINLVTDADKASETLLLSMIRAKFPGHSILAEESGIRAGDDYRWVIDPLDGTTNYAHQVPHFCISVAVERAGVLLAGVILDPIRHELFAAAKGQGATLNGVRIRASDSATLERSLLCTGFPYDVRENPAGPVGLFNRFIRRAQGVRRMGSAALDLAYVACGRFDGFFEFGLKPWDIAAGALLIQEAGGVMLQIDGSTLDLANGNVLAAGPALAPVLIRECGEFLKSLGYGVKP